MTTDTTPELLPCPWCGNQPEVCDEHPVHGHEWTVLCPSKDCHVMVTTLYVGSRETAIEYWNRRTQTPATKTRRPGEAE